jgi:hypothetical protein
MKNFKKSLLVLGLLGSLGLASNVSYSSESH